jgi:hypothetical protein
MLLKLLIALIVIAAVLYYLFVYLPNVIREEKALNDEPPLTPLEDVEILADEADAVAYRKAILEDQLDRKQRKIRKAKKTLDNN